ncbi:Predicted membrane protein [Streptococcus pneumoniae]|nr:Predicted membrane protein [Streptococcus pneumoniae]
MNKIKEDEQTVQKIEEWLQKQVVTLVEKNHSKIGKLVQENLDKLDDKTLIEMIENNVGKDLQWIRVNGAVCGFMIGLVLEGIKAII